MSGMNMKAEIVEGFQESEIRKVCLEGQGSVKSILVSKLEKKGERKFLHLYKKN